MIMVTFEPEKTLLHVTDSAIIRTKTDKKMKRRIARYMIFLLISLLKATASCWIARRYVFSGWSSLAEETKTEEKHTL
jgi:hypothetical protein